MYIYFNFRIFVFFAFFLIFFLKTASATNVPQLVNSVWNNRKIVLQEEMKQRLRAGDVYVLYDMGVYTDNLLKYADKTHDVKLLNDLTRLYLISYSYLILDKDGYKKWFFTIKDSQIAKENPSLVGKEVKLCSCQFLYTVTALIDAITHLAPGQRTPLMQKFVKKFASVAKHDHYERWVPVDSEIMLKKFENPLAEKEKFQNAVSDQEMFVLSGVVQLLAANRQDPVLVPLTVREKKAFLDFVDVGTRLLKNRLTPTNLTDFNGQPIKGLNFDVGLWSDYADYAYAGYTGEQYPLPKDRKQIANVGWDISHARRFVDVFDVLYDNRAVTGQSFPDNEVMKGLANQVAYGVFNRDFKKPLFTNFMDGTNGWYRVGYANRKDFGYGPYKSSSAIPEGGYGFWSRFNPDIRKLLSAFWDWAKRAKQNKDKDFLKYYNDGYWKENGSIQLLEFLPTIVN